ncbi:hypothetical protein WA026_015724 [Henosepilachna vigintioctopunctata]|uniref:Myrosinase 1 n=1 Tax=Henosepilachna vigintioctopunctata TaxID=420089 RepID=A0AAW1UZ95_9CUCU
MSILKGTLSFLGVFHIVCGELSQYSFPDNFQFGVSSSAYQIEGAWNEGGKGVSIWDHSLHSNPDYVLNKSNGDIACDSYHKWKEDIAMLKNLGVQFYRFSISWTRIIPLGYSGSKVNEEGVKYYNDLIDALLAEGIQPFVTIYHWDLPQTLENKGGWLNESIVEDFVYYAKTLFELYGDRVKRWITINEYLQICEYGYSSATLAPFLNLAGVGVYQCSHHALLAHGRVYRLYQNQFKASQKGEVGSVIQAFWCEPKTSSMDDQLAAEHYMQFNFGIYAHPIVYGNYPPIMMERIEALSDKQGFNKSRLPRFTEQQIEMIKGSFDFLGVNHYTTILCSFNDNLPQPSLDSDCGVEISQNSTWKGLIRQYF